MLLIFSQCKKQVIKISSFSFSPGNFLMTWINHFRKKKYNKKRSLIGWLRVTSNSYIIVTKTIKGDMLEQLVRQSNYTHVSFHKSLPPH